MFILSDRVKETSSTVGSGSVALNGAYGAFQSFNQGIGNGNETYYAIENNSRWEVGKGVYTSSSNSLSRDVVLNSSASGAKVNLEGISVVFCTLPASKATAKDSQGQVSLSGIIFSDSTVQTTAAVSTTTIVGISGTKAQFDTSVTDGNFLYVGDAPTSHAHGNITNAGAIGSTTGLPIITTASGILTAGSFGTTAGTFAAGDDSRITGALSTSTAAATYAVIAAGQPISGTIGQVLAKNSGANYDSSWTSLVLGDRYLSTSTTSNAVSNGTKTFTIGTGLAYTPTQNITIAYDATHHMHGEVTTYNSGTGVLVVDINNHTGTGTYTSWVVNVGGVTPATVVSWGDIVGTLGTQSDLSTALNAKLEITTAASTYVPLTRTLNTLALSADQTFAVGTTGTDFAIASSGTAHTFNIPSASATARGLITTGTQTIAGQKTFTSSVLILGGQTNASSIDNSSSGLIIMAPANGAQSSGMAIGSAGTSVYSLHTGDTNSGTADCFFLSSGSPSSVITNKQGTSSVVSLTNGGLKLSSGSSVRWGASHAGRDALSASDLFISRDAAGTLAQRNGTTAQTFRLYNTYTSSTSFENLQFKAVAAAAYQIGSAVGSAGGTNRAIDFGHWNAAGAFTSALSIATTGDATFAKSITVTKGAGAYTSTFTSGSSSDNYNQFVGSSGSLVAEYGLYAGYLYFQSLTGLSGTRFYSNNTISAQFTLAGVTLSQGIATSGSPTTLTVTGAAHTTLTASTEATDVNFNLARTVQFATGALTTQRAMRIQAPTYSFVGASTITTASTLSISGPPVAGTNATITNAYALNVETGSVRISSGSIFQTSGYATFSDVLSVTPYGENSVVTHGGACFGWASNTGYVTAGNSADTKLFRDGAAGVIAQRNGTTAQTLRVYNTYTSSTSYETLNIKGKAAANFEIGPENGSAGGTLRGLTLGCYPAGTSTIVGWAQFRPNASTGALESFYLGPIADSTAVGGNTRGTYSVDLQTYRTAASQVASGLYAVAIGASNIASGENAVAIGIGNNAAGYDVVTIGKNNSGAYGGVAIGWANSASLAGVSLGQGNTASGDTAVAIGSVNTASGTYSRATGRYSESSRYGMTSHASGRFAATGDAQSCGFVVRNKTTDATPVNLGLDGSTTRLTIPSGKTMSGFLIVKGIKSDGSAKARFVRLCDITNVGGTTALDTPIEAIGTDYNPSGCTLAVTAENATDDLQINITGPAGETWRWTATFSGLEIAYGV